MSLSDAVGMFADQLSSLGLAGLVIVGLVSANVALWRALQKERKRNENLVAGVFEMAKEATTMIERVTNR